MSWADWMRYQSEGVATDDNGPSATESSVSSKNSSSNIEGLGMKDPTICKYIKGNYLNSLGKALLRTYLEGLGWTPEDVEMTLQECSETPLVATDTGTVATEESLSGYYLSRALEVEESRRKMLQRLGIIEDSPTLDPFPDDTFSGL